MKHKKLKTLGLLIIVAVLTTGVTHAQDPLLSWNWKKLFAFEQ
jgi:hypothetical protein